MQTQSKTPVRGEKVFLRGDDWVRVSTLEQGPLHGKNLYLISSFTRSSHLVRYNGDQDRWEEVNRGKTH